MSDAVKKPAPNGVDVARLRRIDVFQSLADRELDAIAQCCEESEIPAGTIVLRQGQVADRVYFLEEGAVNVYRERIKELQRLALIEAPGVFGEMALGNQDRVRTATVRAATDLRVLSIPLSDMMIALRCIPVLREQLRLLMQARGQSNEGPDVVVSCESAAFALNGMMTPKLAIC